MHSRYAGKEDEEQCHFVGEKKLSRDQSIKLLSFTAGTEILSLSTQPTSELCQLVQAQKRILLEKLKKLAGEYCHQSGGAPNTNVLRLISGLLGHPSNEKDDTSAVLCKQLHETIDHELSKIPARGWFESIKHGFSSFFKSLGSFLSSHGSVLVQLGAVAGLLYLGHSHLALKQIAAQTALEKAKNNQGYITQFGGVITALGTGLIKPALEGVGIVAKDVGTGLGTIGKDLGEGVSTSFTGVGKAAFLTGSAIGVGILGTGYGVKAALSGTNTVKAGITGWSVANEARKSVKPKSVRPKSVKLKVEKLKSIKPKSVRPKSKSKSKSKAKANEKKAPKALKTESKLKAESKSKSKSKPKAKTKKKQES